MSNALKDKKLHISSKRIILLFVGIFFVFEAIFYISFQFQNGFHFFPFEISFYLYTPILLVLSVIFCYFSITRTYYLIDKDKITHYRNGKVFEYHFRDIVFIDEKWSSKHKTMLFFMNDGRAKYLAFDKEGIIYQYALEYSHLLSEEEFAERFPNVKL